MMRSTTVGIPSFRTPPSGFGISFRRTGWGLYFPIRMLSRSSSRCSLNHGSASSTVIPSIPGAPWLALTRLYALFRFSLLRIRSSRSAPSCSLTSRLPILCAPAYPSCSALSLCGQPGLSRYSAFTVSTSFFHLLGTYDCSVLPRFFSPRVL